MLAGDSRALTERRPSRRLSRLELKELVTAPKLRPPAMSGDRHVVGVANVPRGWSATLVLSGPAGENVQQSTTNGGKLVVASVCDPNAGFGPFAWETQLTYTKPGHDPETLRKVRLLACR
jgi:hypothetical protein